MDFYAVVCREMLHVTPETEAEMDRRLGDWNREYWAADAHATATS